VCERYVTTTSLSAVQFLNISDNVTSTPSRGLLDDPLLSIILDTPAVCKSTARLDSLCRELVFTLQSAGRMHARWLCSFYLIHVNGFIFTYISYMECRIIAIQKLMPGKIFTV